MEFSKHKNLKDNCKMPMSTDNDEEEASKPESEKKQAPGLKLLTTF